MRIKTIGIVGGAGPMAGVFLLKYIFLMSQKIFNCHQDADYPKVIYINYPFSDMLSDEIDKDRVRDELQLCLDDLRNNGATVLAIACNTLHGFLDENSQDLINLMQSIREELSLLGVADATVLCTTTSVKCGIHKQFFQCDYPDEGTQREIDFLIDEILKGGNENQIIACLNTIIEQQKNDVVILGCTELSIYADKLLSKNKVILDPLRLLATNIVNVAFTRGE